MTDQRETALVTGGSGFIGGHLARRLSVDGFRVVALDRSPAAGASIPLPEDVTALECDIRDAAAVHAVFERERPDLVFHLAAQASVSVSMREPELDIETNVLGTVHLARAAANVPIRRFVFFSSGGALYGEPDLDVVGEDHPTAPASVYGASKLAAERYLELLADQLDLSVSIVRPSNVYGPGQDPHGEAGVVAIFAQRMLAGTQPVIFGDGSQERDYVYVDDVVEAAVRAAEVPAVCHAATGVATKTIDVFRAVARACEYAEEPEFADERPGDIQRIALDPSRAGATWGWRPRVAFDEGIRETVSWFRERAGAPR